MIESISKQFDFQPLPENAPEFTCNMCGSKTKAPGKIPQMAAIHPFQDESADYSTVVCSDKCKDQLLTHEAVELYLFDQLLNICNNFGHRLKPDYEAYYEKLQQQYVKKKG